ncbi:MAG: tetratricopeptide repeat protein [Syntrophaceae bacterium]|nr:tetratricopeptide repeat protein [Syntrophaceae bacterium]
MGREPARARKYLFLLLASLISLSLISCALIKEPKPVVMESRPTDEAQEHLLRGQILMAKKNYQEAITEYEKVLLLSPRQPPEDQALFNIALIYAHLGNPKKDYKKSIDLFLRMLKEYPDSPLAEQAKIWVGILRENVESAKKIEKMADTIQDMEKRNRSLQESSKLKPSETKMEEPKLGRDHILQSNKFLAQGNYEGAVGENQKILTATDPRFPKDEALFNLGLIYAHLGNPQRDIDKSIDYFNRLLKAYPKSTLVDQAKIWIGILQENGELNRLIQKLKQVDIEVEEMKRKK